MENGKLSEIELAALKVVETFAGANNNGIKTDAIAGLYGKIINEIIRQRKEHPEISTQHQN